MVKNQTNILGAYGLAALAFVALISSCGGNSNPAAPSAAGGAVRGDVLFALDPGVNLTLKVPAPQLQSPISNVEITDLAPTLVIANAKPLYVPSADLTFRFEVYQTQANGGMVLVHANTTTQTPTTTSYTVNVDLEQAGDFMWRSRAQIGDENGPWSDAATFRTPTLVTVGAPTPLSPADGADVTATRPELIVTNGEVSANAGAVEIEYEINDGATAVGGARFKANMGGGGTTTGMFEDPLGLGQFSWRARASNGPVTSDWSATSMFNVVAGGRAPDPPPGQKLPLPNREQLIQDLADLNPQALGDSCIEEGGTWEFMDEAVRLLRLEDTRWGYNCKRGHCNEPSIDVIDYFWDAGDAQGKTEVYLIDIIGAVCPGGNQSPTWIDQTQVTADQGTIGRWIFPRP
jgi:hypothetical protein